MNRLLSTLLFAGLLASGFATEPTDKPVVSPEAPVEVATQTVAPDSVAAAKAKIAHTGADALSWMADRAKAYTGKLEEGLSVAVDKAMVEIPKTLQEYLAWKAAYHAIFGLSGPIIAIIFMIIMGVAYRQADWSDGDMAAVITIASGVMIVICLWAFIIGGASRESMSGLEHTTKLVQIKVAPRIYLIEELGKLIR
jgi:hypothetical protein